MRKIIVLTFLTLDGVMQAPGGSEEDTAEGFKYGGWSFPYFDEVSGKIMDEQIGRSYDLLLGRKTYDIFAAYWPKQDEKKNSVAAPFNNAKKYVVSHTADYKPTWKNSELITGDVVAKIKKLKAENGSELQVHGSGNLVQTLMKNDLVDEFWLKFFPITLGGGKRLFADGTIPAAFKLIDSKTTPSGVIFANYTRAGEVTTGTFG